MIVFVIILFGITGWRIGSRRFSCRSVSKVGEGWLKSGMGMARYMSVVTCLSSQCKQDVSRLGNSPKLLSLFNSLQV